MGADLDGQPGSWFHLTGGMRDGAMELITTEPDADGCRKRMRFAAITADRFEWTWSRSAADGWGELWRIDYARATT